MLTVIQTNLGRSAAAMDLLSNTAQERRADLVIVAEPNKRMTKRRGWFSDQKGDVAIKSHSGTAKVRRHGAGNGFVWVEIGEIIVYGCYISPNVALEVFQAFLEGLEASMDGHLSAGRRKLIAGGDFNAKARVWGADVEDRRGSILADWVAERDMIVLNRGNEPTFVRGRSKSHIDITIGTPDIAIKVTDWKVIDDENLSLHRDIEFKIDRGGMTTGLQTNKLGKGWRVDPNKMDKCMKRFGEELEKWKGSKGGEMSAQKCTQMLSAACDKTFPKKGGGVNKYRRPVYWWTQEVADKRRRCIASRRILVRQNGRAGATEEERDKAHAEYALQRALLKKAIKTAKKEAWRKLCEEVDDDIWGQGYRITMKKYGIPIPELEPEREREIVRELFPVKPAAIWDDITAWEETPKVTAEDILETADKIKGGKAAGPDGIPPEVVKALAKAYTAECEGMMNSILRRGEFPDEWKIARLVLIEKPNKNGQGEVSYRPLCVLNVMGKWLEYLIVQLYGKELERCGGLSDRQYGFRKGRSTVDAMKAVQEASGIGGTTQNDKTLALMVTLDVENAFNSAPWKGIVAEMKKRKMSAFLRKVVQSYFTERYLISAGGSRTQVTCGVPQGSVLGPHLWNLYYDGVLRLSTPRGVTLIGYADDLAIVIRGKHEVTMREDVQHTIRKVANWMRRKELKLAAHKSELVVLKGRRTLTKLSINVEDQVVHSSEAVKYLGIVFDRNGRMVEHVKRVAKKAETAAMALARIMPNVGGPTMGSRRVLTSVVLSIILYGAPIWCRALKIQKYKQILEKVVRRMLTRICRAYKTVSTSALQTLAGIPPIELLVEERVRVYEHGREEREAARNDVLTKWQRRWEVDRDKAQWTRRLIPDLRAWVERKHGELNFHLTQALSGHGCFQAYLNKIGKADSPGCVYCGEEDTPMHTLFVCVRWQEQRRNATELLGGTFTPDSMTPHMLTSSKKWKVVEDFIVSIIKTKERNEWERQNQQLPMV